MIRAAITLKLCSFEDTGAVLAALTTSVPEAPGTPRTWDYRFSWLRDAFFTVTRSTGCRRRAPWKASCASSSTSSRPAARAARPTRSPRCFRIAPGTDTREADRHPAGLSRLRPGARRQCRRQPAPERHLRLDGADGGADVLGRAPAAPRRHRALSPALRRRQRGPSAALDARCRPLGIPRARGGAHLLRGDVLGGAAPARHDRQRVGVDCRIARMAGARRRAARRRS